jgi:hypothetical protein
MDTRRHHFKSTYSSDELFSGRTPVVIIPRLPTLQMIYYAHDGLIIAGRTPVVTTQSLPTLQMI